jgi:CheY-like chemotaxis protein
MGESSVTTEKKRIFYFEDEPELLRAYFEVLREKYEVIVGASKELVEQSRRQPVDLVIVDLMIHKFTFDEEGNEVQNIHYADVNWQRTGVEFLRRVRVGDYEDFGFSAAVPAIVATAKVDNPIRDEVEALGVKAYLEKPFSVDELKEAVDAALISQENEE